MANYGVPLKKVKYTEDYEEEELDIDVLPDEMLLEIFQHLDEISLVSASKSCFRWDDLIKSDLNLMKKIEYTVLSIDGAFKVFKSIDHGRYHNLFIGTSSRVFIEGKNKVFFGGRQPSSTSNVVTRVNQIPKEIFDEIKASGRTIKSVTLTGLSGVYPADVLKQLEFTEKLILLNVVQQPSLDINLSHLKHLEVYDSSNFLNSIKTHDLKVLKFCDFTSQTFQCLHNFLLNCPSLKELMISSRIRTKFDFNSLNFELSKLSLDNVSLDDDKFLEFLQTQENSLKELSIVSSRENLNIQKSLEFVFFEMNLKYLEISLNCFNNEIDSFLNESIKKLIIWDLNYDRTFYKKLEKILTICGEVEDLSIYKCNNLDAALQIVCRKVPGLKILKLDKVPLSLSPIINFVKLVHLEIDEIGEKTTNQVLPYFVAYCGNLKILKINNLLNFNENEIKKVILSAKKLEEVHLGIKCNFSTSIKETMQQLRHCGRSLKVLRSKHFKLTRESPKIPLKYESSSFFGSSEFKCNFGALERIIEEIRNKTREYGKRRVK